MKGYLSRKHIAFEVRDITMDEGAERELVELGFTAIPVTLVGDAPHILGADFARIDKALEQ